MCDVGRVAVTDCFKLEVIFIRLLVGNESTHHVPDIVSQPVDDSIEAADNLKMFRFDRSLVHKKHHKRRRNKGHGADSEYCDQNIGALLTKKSQNHQQ